MQGHANPCSLLRCSMAIGIPGSFRAKQRVVLERVLRAERAAPECTRRKMKLTFWIGRRSTALERVFFSGDIPPGTLINYWVRANAAYLRSIDPNHMVRAPQS